jgi:hypothetical protein
MKFENFMQKKNAMLETLKNSFQGSKSLNENSHQTVFSERQEKNITIIDEEIITNEELDMFVDFFLKNQEKTLHIKENKINEAETFDLKSFLQKTANYLKAIGGIEAAVENVYKLKIDLEKKKNEFEEKWPDMIKTKEDAIKNQWETKINNADPSKRTALRGMRKEALASLEQKLTEFKTAKLNQFKQVSEDRIKAAEEKVNNLAQPKTGLPDYASTIILGMKQKATNKGEIDLAEEKYKGNEEKLKKAQARIKKKEQEEAKELKTDMDKAEQKMNDAATEDAANIRNSNPGDANISEDDKTKFEDGKDLSANAHEAMAEVKTKFTAVKTKLTAYQTAADAYNTAAETDKDAKEDAMDKAKGELDSAKEDFNSEKSIAEKAINSVINWCNKNSNSTQSDVKGLADQKSAFDKMKEALESFEIYIADAK